MAKTVSRRIRRLASISGGAFLICLFALIGYETHLAGGPSLPDEAVGYVNPISIHGSQHYATDRQITTLRLLEIGTVALILPLLIVSLLVGGRIKWED